MSALSAAASDEDGDTIRTLKSLLGRANALCSARFDRIKELELMLEAVGAGGVGPMVPPTAHHQRDPNKDNDLQRKNGHLITSSSSVPPGWKLVPVEPTPEMAVAGRNAHHEADKKTYEPRAWDVEGFASRAIRASHVYRAMLAAAPQPPVVEQEPVAWICAEWSGTGKPELSFEGPPAEPSVRDELTKPVWTPLYTHPQPRQPLTDVQDGGGCTVQRIQQEAAAAECEACATIDVTPLNIRASDGPGTAILKYRAAIRERCQQ